MKSMMILLLQAATSTTPTPAPSPTPAPTTATPSSTPTPTSTSSRTGTGTTTSSLLPAVSLPVCLQRTVTDARGNKKPFLIAVGPSLVTDLLTGGFTLAPCTGFKISAAQYREEVCASAASGNSAVQARREEVFGVAPKLLCDQATSLGGLLEQVLRPAG